VLEFFFLFVFFSKEKSFDCDEAFFTPFGKKSNRLVVVFIVVVFVSRKDEQKSSSS